VILERETKLPRSFTKVSRPRQTLVRPERSPDYGVERIYQPSTKGNRKKREAEEYNDAAEDSRCNHVTCAH
jgi:hypothetical protein